jgi:NAD-dependent histone deacetylase SIR2
MTDLITPPSSQTYLKEEVKEEFKEEFKYEHPHLLQQSQVETKQKQKRKPKLKYRPPNGTVLNIETYEQGTCISEQDDNIDNEDVSFLHYAFKHSKRMVVVTGAGISVASGIPDFRSSNGLFQGLKATTSPGSNGKALFDSSVYSDGESTAKFHAMINQLYEMTQNSKPTPFHKLINTVSKESRLLRHYTQNIDCLESELSHLQPSVPIKSNPPYPPTIQLHGTIRYMYCSKCRWNSEIVPQMFQGMEPPACPECIELDEIRRMSGKRSQGIGCLRPRIVLYNEFHPDGEHIGKVSHSDLRSKPDCLVIAGTSLKIPGVRRLVKELAKAVHAANGCVIWINRDEPSMSVVDYIEYIDLIVLGDCQDVSHIMENYESYIKGQKGKKRVKRVLNPVKEETSNKVIKKTKQQTLIQCRLEELVMRLNEAK